MYIKLPDIYPYSIAQLRADNFGTSFPASMPDERLADWNVFPVLPVDPPVVLPGQVLEEGAPVEVAGVWRQQWIARAATPQETEAQAFEVRGQRNGFLANCDWTQLADAPVDAAAWATYRQALRDISRQAGFPWDVQWPAPPV